VTVTPDKTARAARAVEALLARHAELQGVLEHWAGVLAATAVSSGPVRPARNLLRAFLADEVLPHPRRGARSTGRRAAILAPSCWFGRWSASTVTSC